MAPDLPKSPDWPLGRPGLVLLYSAIGSLTPPRPPPRIFRSCSVYALPSLAFRRACDPRETLFTKLQQIPYHFKDFEFFP